jgi:hypothetical protein
MRLESWDSSPSARSRGCCSCPSTLHVTRRSWKERPRLRTAAWDAPSLFFPRPQTSQPKYRALNGEQRKESVLASHSHHVCAQRLHGHHHVCQPSSHRRIWTQGSAAPTAPCHRAELKIYDCTMTPGSLFLPGASVSPLFTRGRKSCFSYQIMF